MAGRRRGSGRAKHTASVRKGGIALLFFVVLLIVAALYGVSLVR